MVSSTTRAPKASRSSTVVPATRSVKAPSPAADTSTVPPSETRLRAAALHHEPHAAPTETDQLHALLTALLTFIASWRPQLTDPVALVVLRGVEALLGTLCDRADNTALPLTVETLGPVVGLRRGDRDELRTALLQPTFLAFRALAHAQESLSPLECSLPEKLLPDLREVRVKLWDLSGHLCQIGHELTGTDCDETPMVHAVALVKNGAEALL